jgi:DNA-directed RNA polymerase specialized sigma24 family protein
MTNLPVGCAIPVAAEETPAPDRSLDHRALHTMMAVAAYHARRVARTMRLSSAEREDAEQGILVTLLERRRYFDPARGPWLPFADRVARQAVQTIADALGAERQLRGPSLDQPVGKEGNARTFADVLANRIVDSDAEAQFEIARALAQFIGKLPTELRAVAVHVFAEEGELGDAQRRSGLSSSEFYRRLRELRFRLVCEEIASFPQESDSSS